MNMAEWVCREPGRRVSIHYQPDMTVDHGSRKFPRDGSVVLSIAWKASRVGDPLVGTASVSISPHELIHAHLPQAVLDRAWAGLLRQYQLWKDDTAAKERENDGTQEP